ncbi:hypothetical protein CC1G_01066 [Coprinopsis cinerea okayama7|uniref:Nascent polypeptide-associated complex subunit alpha-like UBA domain-containing protein n=1 Tax=Coprinopsis cinerea (strain Okayama-7 / 130 / ATCC MYA-4618 / FGSC 9003) TaxID=240176 RepID=A8NEE5_COPC7|nr:hypothetical protein CC1G_01066 [Coprinopsis cinerea okayama7\|eukprot:XP_001833004.1 hypothetical protein CC1G_01066 [Coprinopsis cinerea okayama7\
MSRINGPPEAEVIVNYADGFAYSKNKLEDAFRPGGFLENPPAKTPRDPGLASLSKADVEVIVHEFDIPKAQAERVLLENGGDLKKALDSLIYPAA